MTARGPAHIRDGRPDLRPIAIALGVMMLDATTKLLAAALASHGLGLGFVLPVQNSAFSLGLAAAPFPITLVLAGLAILGFGGYTVRQAHRGKVPDWVPGLLIGGAVANLLDRLLFGAVHDWLYLPKVTVNLADIAVLVGLLLFGYSSARRQHSSRNAKRPSVDCQSFFRGWSHRAN